MFIYLFKTLELVRYYQMILILALMCCCILANKAAESYEFFADQTSPTSSKSLWNQVKYSELRNVGEEKITLISPTFRKFLTGLENYCTIKSWLSYLAQH